MGRAERACVFEEPVRGGAKGGPGVQKLSAFCEKAVLTDKGEIVLFFLVCDITEDAIWRRFQVLTYIISADEGYTWSEPAELCDSRGRVYDAKYYNGEILALHFKNDNEINFVGNKDEHVYELYVSKDGSRTFTSGAAWSSRCGSSSLAPTCSSTARTSPCSKKICALNSKP